MRVLFAFLSLGAGVAAPASAETGSAVAGTQSWLQLAGNGAPWLLAAVAILALTAVVTVVGRRSAKIHRRAQLQVQALEKRLRNAHAVAESERQWLNNRNRELQNRVDRMAQEAKSERVASLLGAGSTGIEGGFTPLRPMRSSGPDNPAAPREAPVAGRMLDAIEKTSNHLQSVEDAAASLVPDAEGATGRPRPGRRAAVSEGPQPPPTNVRMFRPLRGPRR